MRTILASAIAGSLLAAAAAHAAGTATATFPVSATVNSTCSANTSGLAFGAYTPGGGNVTGQATINVICTKSTGFTVKLNAGTTSGGSFAQRLMALSGATTNTLQYNLYTTTALSTVFGDGTNSTGTATGTGAGLATPQVVNVYGQIPDNATNQSAVPTSTTNPTYNDTITVTVTY